MAKHIRLLGIVVVLCSSAVCQHDSDNMYDFKIARHHGRATRSKQP